MGGVVEECFNCIPNISAPFYHYKIFQPAVDRKKEVFSMIEEKPFQSEIMTMMYSYVSTCEVKLLAMYKIWMFNITLLHIICSTMMHRVSHTTTSTLDFVCTINCRQDSSGYSPFNFIYACHKFPLLPGRPELAVQLWFFSFQCNWS